MCLHRDNGNLAQVCNCLGSGLSASEEEDCSESNSLLNMKMCAIALLILSMLKGATGNG